MSGTYADYSQSAVETLTSNWFTPDTPSNWVPGDYWKTPTICQELVFYMQFAGVNTYVPTLENARNSGEYWLNTCGYYDDLTCWGRFFVSAYNYLTAGGSGADPQNYLNDAITCHQNFVQAWDQTCGGGIWWKRDTPNFKACNSTLGAMEIALGLYFATGQQPYLDWATQAWKWLKGSGMLAADGYVWGGLTPTCTVDPKNHPVVALQGNPLAPLWLMYKASGDTACLDVAQTIVATTMKAMVWQNTQILQASADADWNAATQQWKESQSGVTPFKGIFAGFLGNFTVNLATVSDPARQQAAKQYAAFLAANADAVWANFPAGNFGMDWHTYSPSYQVNSDSQINAGLQYGALAVFLAAALTSQLAEA